MKRLLIVSVFLAAIIVALAVLMTTSAGVHLAARLALPLVPGETHYESLGGRLVGPVRIGGLSWREGERELQIDELEVDWETARLLRRHLHFESIAARGVRWRAPAAAPAARADDEPFVIRLPELPITITLARATVEDIAIDQGDTQLRISSLFAAGQLDANRYRVEAQARSPQFEIAATADIALEAPHALDAHATIRLPEGTGEWPALEATIRLDGDTELLEYALTSRGALELVVSGRAHEPLGEMQITGRARLNAIDPALAGFDSRDLTAQFDYTLDPRTLEIDGRLLAPAWLRQPVAITARAGAEGGDIRLERAVLQLEGQTMRVSATGRVARDLSDATFELQWTDLRWPLVAGAAQLTSPRGSASLSGTPDAYGLQMSARVVESTVPAAAIELRGSGSRTGLDIAALNARFEDAGALGGSGRIEWGETPRARLQLAGREIIVERFASDLTGRASFDATLDATLAATGPRVHVDLRELDGELRGKTLRGSGRIEYRPTALIVEALDLRAGEARFEATGAIADEVNLRWRLDVPDLSLIVPGAAGQIASSGQASGTRAQPALSGELSARGLSHEALAAETVEGRFSLGLDAAAAADVYLDADELRVGGTRLGTVSARSEGTIPAHTITLAVDGPAAALTGRLRGGLDGQHWRGEVATLDLTPPRLGTWTLAAPVALSLAPTQVSLERACLRQDDARLCAQGNWAGNPAAWSGSFELQTLPLAAIAPLLAPGLSYEGSLSGAGRIDSGSAPWLGDARLELTAGRVLTSTDEEEDVLLGFQSGSVELRFDTRVAKARLALDLRDTGRLDADLTLPLDARAPLGGTVYARVENLSLVPAVVPQVGRIDGRIEAKLDVAGTRESVELSGDIALDAAAIVLPELGITLTETTGRVETRDDELRFTGGARSGEGRVELDGKLRWRERAVEGDLRLNGERFRAIQLPAIWLDASPDVTVSVSGREIRIEGEVTVPAASITPIDIDRGIGVSSDQIIVGESANARDEEGWRINGRMRVTAGDAVQIEGFGLEGRLAGSVLIIDQPRQPTIGRGALEIVDGQYRAYGQKLTIETGRLEFTGGPIDDPGIDLRAARVSGDVTAGVQVRGALRNPSLTLYTIPAMSDTQAMSYLITGRGIEELDEAGQVAVSDAATRLALKGGSLLAASLGRGLGLDSVDIKDDGATANTSLVIGKHLSPKLFVSYGIGLFEAINTLRLRYQINPRLTLQTESGLRTSADLLYSFER